MTFLFRKKMETERAHATQVASEAGSVKDARSRYKLSSVFWDPWAHESGWSHSWQECSYGCRFIRSYKICFSCISYFLASRTTTSTKWLGKLAQYTYVLTTAVKEWNPNFVANKHAPPSYIFSADYFAAPASSSNS